VANEEWKENQKSKEFLNLLFCCADSGTLGRSILSWWHFALGKLVFVKGDIYSYVFVLMRYLTVRWILGEATSSSLFCREAKMSTDCGFFSKEPRPSTPKGERSWTPGPAGDPCWKLGSGAAFHPPFSPTSPTSLTYQYPAWLDSGSRWCGSVVA